MDEDEKPPKLRKDGQPDGRGLSLGSRSSQFARGDARKRGVRGKGARDERTIVLSIRSMKSRAIKADGSVKRVTTPEAILLALRSKAIAGDLKAAEFLMRRFDRYEAPSAEPDRTRVLLEEDEVILATARCRGLANEEIE